MKAIRISYDSGEYFVSAKRGANFKPDSVYHDINKAFNRAFALLEGDAKKVESERLVARVRELEAQNAELLAALIDAARALEWRYETVANRAAPLYETEIDLAYLKAKAVIGKSEGGA